MNDRCLTDEEIASYVDGVVKPSLRKQIEEHLANCNFCLHNVVELKQLLGSEQPDHAFLSQGAMAKAVSMIARHTRTIPEFDITAVIRNGICKILESTGDLLPPRRLAPVPVRREKRKGLSPRIARTLSGYLVTVELTSRKASVQPKLTLVEESTSLKPDGVKAKLYSPGACETKYSHKGEIIFSLLNQGSFRIDIEGIGSIGLEIK